MPEVLEVLKTMRIVDVGKYMALLQIAKDEESGYSVIIRIPFGREESAKEVAESLVRNENLALLRKLKLT
jgi:hypothetical protein